MPRRRMAAVLLVPPPWATEIDGLRRACGDHMLDRVAPHVTLVSPVNVAESDVGTALEGLRRGAAAVRHRLALEIGPAATFTPASPVLHLSVRVAGDGDAPGAVDGLHAIQNAVRHGPLSRPPRWPWVPHVTIGQDQPGTRLHAGVEALADYRITVAIDRVHLMEERAVDDGPRVWVPIADVVIGPTAVVGRGSLPLELTTGAIIDPECVELADRMGIAVPVGATAVVVAARRADGGDLVGVAVSADGSGDVTWQVLAPGAATEGVDGHLAARVRWVATA